MQNLKTSYANILKITAPLVVAGIAMNLVGVIDLMLVANLGEAQIGGTGNGQIIYGFLFVIGMGFTSGIQIIIGRRNGERDFKAIGALFYQGLYFVAFFATVLFLFIQFLLPMILGVMFDSQNVIHYSGIYLETRGYGIIFTLTNLLFIGYFVGITKTKVLGYFTPLISILNISLDILLINGYGAIPALGVQGAAMASVISEGAGTLLFIGYTLKVINLEKYNLNKFIKFNWAQTKRIWNLSSPIMLQNLISIGSWLFFFTFVEYLGERSLAISQIIRGIYIFVMVPVFSLADATNTFVSNLMGEKRFKEVIPLIIKTNVLGLLVNLLFFVVIHTFPHFLLGLFTSNPQIIEQAIPSLTVVTFTMFVFSFGLMPFRALSGTGNTKTALSIEIVAVSIYLVFTYYITVIEPRSLAVVWSSEFVYFGILLVLSWWYLLKGNWAERKL